MRALITGAAGFAGRHLARHCAQQGCSTLIGVGRQPREEADPPPELTQYQEPRLAEPAEPNRVIPPSHPDRVSHPAAGSSAAGSWQDPARGNANNACATLNLLEAVGGPARGVRVLVACSGEEYGQPERLPLTEDHPLRPK